MIVVADTSPINYLVLIGHIEILEYFYDQVIIPAAVWMELQDANTPDPVRRWALALPPWMEVRSLTIAPDPSLDFLDTGEREAIALALELHADRLIADETLARQEAVRRGLNVIGTLGILRNGAGAHLLELPEALRRLQETTFYVAPELIQFLLNEDSSRPK